MLDLHSASQPEIPSGIGQVYTTSIGLEIGYSEGRYLLSLPLTRGRLTVEDDQGLASDDLVRPGIAHGFGPQSRVRMSTPQPLDVAVASVHSSVVEEVVCSTYGCEEPLRLSLPCGVVVRCLSLSVSASRFGQHCKQRRIVQNCS
jgi:hypothetical protein